MRILVLGSKGGLGTSFLEYGPRFSTGHEWIGFDRSHVDITDLERLGSAIKEAKPEILLNATGYTAVDKAEEERDLAHTVNATAVGTMAETCASLSIPFVTWSTDFVFEGREFTPRREIHPALSDSVYGKTKKEGEDLALRYSGSLVIRTSWLYSEFGKSFPRTILTKAKIGETMKIVSDQVATPTWSHDMVQATMKLIERKHYGLLHFANSGEASWFDFAKKAIELYGFKTKTELKPPLPIRTGDFPAKAKRPAYSVLDTSKAKGLGIERRSWESALSEFLDRSIARGIL